MTFYYLSKALSNGDIMRLGDAITRLKVNPIRHGDDVIDEAIIIMINLNIFMTVTCPY